MERRMMGNYHVRCEAGENPAITSKGYLSLFPAIQSAEMMFSASRSRRISIVAIIQSYQQLEKHYGKERAAIIADNTQLTETTATAPPEETTFRVPVERREDTALILSAVKAEADNDLSAKSQTPDDTSNQTRAEKIREDNAAKMELGNLSSAVIYRNIFPSADLEYIVSPGKIKENIIVKEAQREYVYQFDLSLDGLIPVPQEDGSIYLLKSAEDTIPLFIIEAPYMYDAAGAYSTALMMELATDGRLTLVADAAWVNAEGREFPVVIDPTLVASTYSGIHDTYVKSSDPNGKHNNAQELVMGYYSLLTSYTARAYIKFDLPDLPDGSIVYSAILLLQQNAALGINPNQLVAYDCKNKAWDVNNLTWNNQPFSTAINGNTNETALDYFNTINSPVGSFLYHWDITKAAKYWYENNGTNNGIMLANRNESAGPSINCASANNSTTASRPAVLISYTNNTGLESYWDYEVIDHGRFGTAYVNDYNGEFTYVLNAIALSGERNPLNISHVYNSSRENRQHLPPNMKLGTGFRLNLSEQIVPVPAGALHNLGYHYKLIDADGTVHYFTNSGVSWSGLYYLENDQDWWLELHDINSLYPFQLVSLNSDAKKLFNANGYLAEICDSRNNWQTITWNNGKIIQVKDGAGRVATLGYDSNNFLTSITDPAGRVTSIFYYPDGTLWGIWYPDIKNANHHFKKPC